MTSPETQLPHLGCKSRRPQGCCGFRAELGGDPGSCVWSQHGGLLVFSVFQTPFSWPLPTCWTPAPAGGRQQSLVVLCWLTGCSHPPTAARTQTDRRTGGCFSREGAVSPGVLREGGKRRGWPRAPLPHTWARACVSCGCRSQADCDSGRHILTCPREQRPPIVQRPRPLTLPALSSSNHRYYVLSTDCVRMWRFAGRSPSLSSQPPCQAIFMAQAMGGDVVKSVRRGMETGWGPPPRGWMQSPSSLSLCLAPGEGWRRRGGGGENIKITTSMHISQHLHTPFLLH